MFCMNHNRVTSTEISRVRVTHERTLEISSYCLFTEVYYVLYAAVFSHIHQRCGQGICPTAENLWQNTSAKTRFYRALMGNTLISGSTIWGSPQSHHSPKFPAGYLTCWWCNSPCWSCSWFLCTCQWPKPPYLFSISSASNRTPRKKSRACNHTAIPSASVSVGNLVFLQGNKNELKVCEKYFVVSASDKLCCELWKFTNSQFHSKVPGTYMYVQIYNPLTLPILAQSSQDSTHGLYSCSPLDSDDGAIAFHMLHCTCDSIKAMKCTI